jgi:hypothetical protein
MDIRKREGKSSINFYFVKYFLNKLLNNSVMYWKIINLVYPLLQYFAN